MLIPVILDEAEIAMRLDIASRVRGNRNRSLALLWASSLLLHACDRATRVLNFRLWNILGPGGDVGGGCPEAWAVSSPVLLFFAVTGPENTTDSKTDKFVGFAGFALCWFAFAPSFI